MRLPARALPIVLLCLSAAGGFSQKIQPDKVPDSLLQSFFSDFNLPEAADAADLRLRHSPKDVVGLLVRMETAELTTVTDPTTVAHGVGMKTDMTLKIVEFLSEFHSTTQPSKLR